MPTDRSDCVNRETNLQMCSCTNVNCANHGICCECLQAHGARGQHPNCMRGTKRNPASLGLTGVACAVNAERNRQVCVCDYEPCSRKGTCCNCVRNHFNTSGTGTVACARNLPAFTDRILSRN